MPDRSGLSLFFFPVLFACLLISGCANIVSPSGGPVDKDPPTMVSESPANGSTNFTARKVQICFDEYIQLKEPQKNIIISPPLEFKPEITSTPRCLVIELDKREKLKENITYTISMAGSVVDLHEGNIIPDYTYAFATGPVIDSHSVSGQVSQAFTLKKEASYTVGLFKEFDDSTLFNQQPVYTAQSFPNGQFRLKRIKSGTYHLAAYKDENANQKLDPGEWLAFYPETITVPDSIQFNNLSSWPGYKYPRNKIVDTILANKHVAKLVFYQPETVPTFKKPFISRVVNNDDVDTIYVFDTPEGDSVIKLEYTIGSTSASFHITNRSASLMPNTLSVAFEYPDSVIITSTTPITSLNKDSILIKRDTLPVGIYPSINLNNFTRAFRIKDIKPGLYKIYIGKGFITDIYNQLSLQTSQICFVKGPENFGSIGLNIKNTGKRPFLIQLVDEKNGLIRNIPVSQNRDIKLNYLNAGTYKIRMVYDINKNGKWDGGDLTLKKQPEKVHFFSTPIQIRADWDIDNNLIDLDQLK